MKTQTLHTVLMGYISPALSHCRDSNRGLKWSGMTKLSRTWWCCCLKLLWSLVSLLRRPRSTPAASMPWSDEVWVSKETCDIGGKAWNCLGSWPLSLLSVSSLKSFLLSHWWRDEGDIRGAWSCCFWRESLGMGALSWRRPWEAQVLCSFPVVSVKAWTGLYPSSCILPSKESLLSGPCALTQENPFPQNGRGGYCVFCVLLLFSLFCLEVKLMQNKEGAIL